MEQPERLGCAPRYCVLKNYYYDRSLFKSKTLLIVGAGASCEAGLPSGEELKKKIASLLDIRFNDGWNQSSGDDLITQALRERVREPDGRNGDINPYLHKGWRIRDVVPSAAISIDNFLDAHQGDGAMELCGKLAIVRSILNAERASKLQSEDPGGNRYSLRGMAGTWYVSFFQMLTENVAKVDASRIFDNVTIITFNYDRCIERFLVQAIADYYDIEIGISEEIVRKVSIYHPYGKVGGLPWERCQSSINFGADRVQLLPIASQIKTFAEGLDDDQLIKDMHDAVESAETIIFLGFAFHPSNMQLLAPNVEANVKRIFATTLGLSDADEAVVEDDIFRMLGLEDMDFVQRQGIQPQMAKLTCYEFFRQYFRSLSAPLD